jgi:hypothetical protein
MSNYKELYDLIVKSFLADGYEIYKQCNWLTTVRRWKFTETEKIMEVMVNIIYDQAEDAEQILVRYAYYQKE